MIDKRHRISTGQVYYGEKIRRVAAPAMLGDPEDSQGILDRFQARYPRLSLILGALASLAWGAFLAYVAWAWWTQ